MSIKCSKDSYRAPKINTCNFSFLEKVHSPEAVNSNIYHGFVQKNIYIKNHLVFYLLTRN